MTVDFKKISRLGLLTAIVFSFGSGTATDPEEETDDKKVHKKAAPASGQAPVSDATRQPAAEDLLRAFPDLDISYLNFPSSDLTPKDQTLAFSNEGHCMR